MSDVTSPDCLAGGGDMGALMRSLDWSSTPLGPVSDWPQSLRTAVSICLNSRFPLLIWWGPELIKIYNDAYRPILGASKHPKALGQRGSECWPEIWHIIGPMLEGVMTRGQSTWSDDQLLLMDRNGYLEEAYFTFSYSPIRDESGGVGGIFTAVTETTQRVLGERRLQTLRELTSEGKTIEKATKAAVEVLEGNPKDMPFALIYLLDDSGKMAKLAGTLGIDAGTPASPALVDLSQGQDSVGWPLAKVASTGTAELIDDLETRFGSLPRRPWPEPPKSALVMSLSSHGQEKPSGLMVLGISPRRAFDDDYLGFFDLVAGKIAAAISNARAYEEERKRAEALVELDRAKTTFFSNVSHEFRTPLTLMLGPLEDLLGEDLASEDKEQVSLIHRNGLRLLKLVNTLLDFSRIEAGRVQAVYEPTDLAAYTAELASVFRSTIEKGGLRLDVDCPALPEPIYVDREMWEKIVLNLLSNAFKFTFEGEISVSLQWCGDHVELRVLDTGTGIAPEELPHLFERFHRIKGAKSRSYEGTGIGLALVVELVKLHGGSIRAESLPGEGTTFTVTMPTGRAHLPSDRIGAARTLSSTSTGSASYVEEALRWLPEGISSDSDLDKSYPAYAPADGSRARVLLADDNADMRGYIHRLLSNHYEVEAVADGNAALDAAMRNPPDLILSDIMMPILDGFELLNALREDPRTQSIPVIFLSARAGEEAKAEGMEAGADDYLVKPFSARELMARVAAHLQIARVRHEAALKERELRKELEKELDERKRAEEALRESESRLRSLFENSPDAIFLAIPGGQVTNANPAACEIFGMTEEELCRVGRKGIEDPTDPRHAIAVEERARTGKVKYETTHVRKDGTKFPSEVSSVIVDGGSRSIVILRDITQRKQAENELREAKDHLEIRVKERTSELEQANRMLQEEVAERIRIGDALESSRRLLRHIIDHTPALVYVFDREERLLVANRALGDLLNRLPEELIGKKRHEFMAKSIADRDEENDRQVVAGGVPMTFEEAGTFEGDEVITFLTVKFPIRNENGEIYAVGGISTDITERKQMEEALIRAKVAAEAATRAKAEFLANMSHEIRTPMNAVIGITGLLLEEPLTPEQRDNLEQVRINGDALLTLINDILDFSKMESDKVVLEEYQFNLRQCVEEALDLVALLASEKGINLAYAIDKNVPDTISGDFGRLRQVLGNLLSNAVKFTDKGEVALSVSSQQIDGANEVHFRVQDTGIGIPQDRMDRLFQPFSQMEPSTTRFYGGTGLGLVISKKLVDLMGGRIWAESEVGKGSTFHFTISAASGQFELEPVTVSPQMMGKNILIIEDNKTNRRILSKQVYDWGMIPMAATSSQEALSWVMRGDDFDIAILDMDLEDMSCLCLEEEIRKYNKTLPLVLLASLGKHVPPNHAYLTKPIKPSQLRKVLTQILPRQPLRRVEAHAASGPGQYHPLRILLAEDNVSSQKVALQMLKKLGYKADVVANGIEALHALERQHYDVVLMDLRMPEMDGLEATRILRQRWPGDGPKVIAITAFALEGDREKCLEAGMDDYIAKPVEINDLRAVLERNLAGKSATERLR